YSYPFLKPAEGDKINSSLGYAIQAHLGIVKVDPITYDVKILKYVIIHDVGKILKKELLEGQTIGSLFHGIAETLYERLTYDEEGNPLVTTFDAYETPTLSEALDIEVIMKHFESQIDYIPSGALGGGEGPMMGVLATIINAISNALGRRIKSEVPITPEKLMEVMK
ncbi:xanthine dehydrogenase, partial [Sulfolobus sp. A20-N-G8]